VIAIQRTFEIVGPLAQADQSILDRYDMDKIAQFVPTVTGMPSALLRNDDQVKKIRNERQAAMAAQQKKQDLMSIAEGAGKIAPLVKTMNESGQGLPTGKEAESGNQGI